MHSPFVGVAVTAVSVLWVADPGGATTGLLRAFYRAIGPWVWPWGEKSYVAFNRYSGVFGIVVGVIGTVASLR